MLSPDMHSTLLHYTSQSPSLLDGQHLSNETSSYRVRGRRGAKFIMDNFNQFDHVFAFNPSYTYDHKTIEVILSNRNSLENGLFFDRLIRTFQVGIPNKLYPPKSNEDLRALHQKIVSSTALDHHKQSLLFYILLDCKIAQDVADDFADFFHLPEKFAICMRGLWYMDRLQFQIAVEYLTQPSLGTTFPEEILATLVKHAPPNDFTLPLAYYHTVSPALTNAKSLDTFFSVLCRVSVTEAFYFSHGQASSVHKRLFEQLISFALSHARGEERSNNCAELVNLPLTQQEESWLEGYLLTGDGKSLNGSRDTVMMRRIGTGKFQEVMDDRRGPSGRKVQGLNWDSLQEGLSDGLGQRQMTMRSMGS
ncbi:MAG: hypothetical protein M1833_001320 [Piccolia ochrophora]|nr:MAG: hypothetical protein M1833_001320 [Piccolia ochrophora]